MNISIFKKICIVATALLLGSYIVTPVLNALLYKFFKLRLAHEIFPVRNWLLVALLLAIIVTVLFEYISRLWAKKLYKKIFVTALLLFGFFIISKLIYESSWMGFRSFSTWEETYDPDSGEGYILETYSNFPEGRSAILYKRTNYFFDKLEAVSFRFDEGKTTLSFYRPGSTPEEYNKIFEYSFQENALTRVR